MKKTIFFISAVLFGGLVLAGCKASYPRQNVETAVQKLIKQEYGIDGRAKLEGETLYLEVNLAGLISTEQKALNDILKKVQGAALVITRVALSSDAKIRFMVLVVSEPTFKLNLRIIQRLDDIKGFLYQKISKNDYEDRLVLEIEKGTEEDVFSKAGTTESTEIGMKEFVGRLIVSQINNLSRSNPFLAVMLGNTQLKYIDFKDEELVIGSSNKISEKVRPFFEDMIASQSVKISKKYVGFGPKRVKLVDNDNQSTLIEVNAKRIFQLIK